MKPKNYKPSELTPYVDSLIKKIGPHHFPFIYDYARSYFLFFKKFEIHTSPDEEHAFLMWNDKPLPEYDLTLKVDFQTFQGAFNDGILLYEDEHTYNDYLDGITFCVKNYGLSYKGVWLKHLLRKKAYKLL